MDVWGVVIHSAVRALFGLEKKTHFYQVSTSVFYGLVQENP